MRLNNSHSSFTLLELLIVIVIIGILASTLNFNFAPDNLQLASDNLIKNIRFTQSLALKDDKYQPFPNHICDDSNDGKMECNRSKYWFKQWWQIRFFRNSAGNYLVEIFSDLPYYSDNDLFDKKGREPRKEKYWNLTYAKDPLTGKYLTGECRNNDDDYIPCNEIDKDLNLSKVGIQKILFNGKNIYSNSPKRLVFDNFGNIFLNEGKYAQCPSSYTGDCGDINPLDIDNRELLDKNVNIKLCLDDSCSDKKCIQINITPNGYIYKSKCN